MQSKKSKILYTAKDLTTAKAYRPTLVLKLPTGLAGIDYNQPQ